MRCFLVSKRRVLPSRLVCFAASVLATVASMAAPGHAGVITFGSGSNQFNMEFVTIGNPGNLADTTGTPNPAGAVGYTYAIGKFEVSEDMITKYNANFGTANSLVITTTARGLNKPATRISWNEAARFVNWLNTSTGNHAAYKFTTSGVDNNIALWTSGDAGYDASNPYRNSLAKYFLPSYNEWYKAAYYNPNDSTWYDYANGSDTAPTAVASGTTADTAVYGQPFAQGPADVTQAGGLSPYGVMGLGGNALEYEETSFDLANSSSSSRRGRRGGSWLGDSSFMSSSTRGEFDPTNGSNDFFGFRVASLSSSAAAVPEPTSTAIVGLAALGMAYRARRNSRNKA